MDITITAENVDARSYDDWRAYHEIVENDRLENVTQCDLNKVASFINNGPMKLLGFKTPYQVFVALAA